MFDTVWIQVTVVQGIDFQFNNVLGEQYLMFGPTGIVGFKSHEQGSRLSNGYIVSETPEQILSIIGKIRRTTGIVQQENVDAESVENEEG